MKPSEALIAIVELAGGKLEGRTTLQKLAYFASENHLCEFEFRPHFYGPYSDEVSSTVGFLTLLELLNEKVVVTGDRTDGWLRQVSGDVRTYTYTLPESGHELAREVRSQHSDEWVSLERIVAMCKEETDLRPGVLATAAKIHFIFTRGPPGVLGSAETVRSTANEFGWQLSDRDIGKVEDLLGRLGLPAVPLGHDAARLPA